MKKWLIVMLSASALQACVTINIYFPAAAAEKAADKIIDDVWQLKNGQKNEGGEKPTEPSSGQETPNPETSNTAK
jgi:hypothetical protein